MTLDPTITAAVIAAAAAYIGLVISKEQKTSEFRQAWIDALCIDLTNLVSNLIAVHGYALSDRCGGNHDIGDIAEYALAVNTSVASIRMRLNPGESESNKLLDALCSIESLFEVEDSSDHVDLELLYRLANSLPSLVNPILKKEWERVKRGEPIFYRLKLLVIASFVGCVVIFLASMFMQAHGMGLNLFGLPVCNLG